jgi:hypothetical protein
VNVTRRIAIVAFGFVATVASAQEAPTRLSPIEIGQIAVIRSAVGTSGVRGIQTRILAGDPKKTGPYTISIQVPPNTHIAAHAHRDDRSGVVAAGLWHFGFGTLANETGSKSLPVGSFYTEPAEQAHFAWTGVEGATVYISGFGPSDTRYSAVEVDSHPLKPTEETTRAKN